MRVQRTVLGLIAGLAVAGCSSAPPPKGGVTVEVDESVVSNRQDPDVARVVEGVQMVMAGHIQAAIDGPFDEVVKKYESRYDTGETTIYSARGGEDAVLYAGLAMSIRTPHRSVRVIGPAWAMAYWGCGYAYDEMARYDDALVEMKKALALAPLDAQYNIEIGFIYQRRRDWASSLEHYKTAEAYASATLPEDEVAEVTCKAFRGQGYDLVEMHRFDQARAAYRSCLKLMPGEPKSTGELKYIDQAEARAKQPD
jgi:tetratricopeptide (TPR) repeat protein